MKACLPSLPKSKKIDILEPDQVDENEETYHLKASVNESVRLRSFKDEFIDDYEGVSKVMSERDDLSVGIDSNKFQNLKETPWSPLDFDEKR